MIIVPTEKRFDWKHAPIALFAIVLLNMMVYFFYQTGDNARFGQAVEQYKQQNILGVEWPVFKEYMLAHGNKSELADYEDTYRNGRNNENLIANILSDFKFTLYLEKNIQKYITNDIYLDWKSKRHQVNEIINSMSDIRFGLIPANLNPLTLLTYQFLHGGLMHLVGNMFFLVMCGFAVEATIGHLRFLGFYLASGVVAGLAFSVLDLDSIVPLVGASGSISGVMAMYLAVFRLKKIEFFYWFFVFVGYIRLPALVILPIYIGKEVVSYLTDTGSNIAFMAHAGGFVAGAIFILVTQFFQPAAFNEEYLESEPDADPRRELMAKYYSQVGSYQFASALKTLDKIIQDFGMDFDLLLLRYNLLKLTPGKPYYMCVLQLLTLQKLPEGAAPKVAAIWRQNAFAMKYLKDEQKLKLGWRMCTFETLDCAEDIFTNLVTHSQGLNGLAEFARHLADTFNNYGDISKARKYRQQSTNLV